MAANSFLSAFPHLSLHISQTKSSSAVEKYSAVSLSVAHGCLTLEWLEAVQCVHHMVPAFPAMSSVPPLQTCSTSTPTLPPGKDTLLWLPLPHGVGVLGSSGLVAMPPLEMAAGRGSQRKEGETRDPGGSSLPSGGGMAPR